MPRVVVGVVHAVSGLSHGRDFVEVGSPGADRGGAMQFNPALRLDRNTQAEIRFVTHRSNLSAPARSFVICRHDRTGRIHDEISISSVYYSMVAIGGRVQPTYDENPILRRRGQSRRVPACTAGGSTGAKDETAGVVCTTCWRCVTRASGPFGLRCPRCGAPLPLGGGSPRAQTRTPR